LLVLDRPEIPLHNNLSESDGGTTGTLGSGAIVDDGSLVFDRSNTISVASAISGTGGLTQAGTGMLDLTNGGSTYSGGTTIQAGTLSFANGALGSTGSVVFAANATLQWSADNTQDISSRLTIGSGVNATLDVGDNIVIFATSFGANGSGAIIKDGIGVLDLAAANSYSGGTTVNAGTVSFVNGGFGTGAITVNGITPRSPRCRPPTPRSSKTDWCATRPIA
jgi:autotransporter-associated beta strand protein